MQGTKPPMLAWHTAVAFPANGCILIYGGAIVKWWGDRLHEVASPYDAEDVNAEVYAYFPEHRRWTLITTEEPHQQRKHHSARCTFYKTT